MTFMEAFDLPCGCVVHIVTNDDCPPKELLRRVAVFCSQEHADKLSRPPLNLPDPLPNPFGAKP